MMLYRIMSSVRDPHQKRRRIPEPHKSEKSDRIRPHRSKKPDPGPHESDEDPQQCMPVREPNEVAVYAGCNKMRIERTSDADPGCLSRILIFSIPDSGSKRFPDPDPHQRI
jgi:hypothetical protein